MERLFKHMGDITPISTESKTFLKKNAIILDFQKNEFYIDMIERKHYWCFVVAGIVAQLSYSPSGKQILDYISVANEYYTGTDHPFTRNSDDKRIKFLQKSTIIQIPNHVIQYAQQNFLDVSEFLHTLKQKRISRLQEMVKILRQDNKREQLLAFKDKLPELAALLTQAQILDFLRMDKSTFQRARKDHGINF